MARFGEGQKVTGGWTSTPGKPGRFSRKKPAHPMTPAQERAFLEAAAVASRGGVVTQCPARYADGGYLSGTRAGVGALGPARRAEYYADRN